MAGSKRRKSRKSNRDILVVDVEATCWENDSDRPEDQVGEIIEVGMALVNRTDLTIKRLPSIIVKPATSTVSPFCTKLTTITQAEVDQGIPFADACKIINKQGNVAWASWGDYDRIQFERDSKLNGVRFPFGRRHLNVKELFAQVYDIKKGPGMDQALNMLNLELMGTHHRGGDDAYNIARILVRMYKTFRGEVG